MKRIMLLVLIVGMVICGFPLFLHFAHADRGVTVPPPTAGQAGSPSADAMQEQLIAQERLGMDALKTGDVAPFGSLLADDAVFVDDHASRVSAYGSSFAAVRRLRSSAAGLERKLDPAKKGPRTRRTWRLRGPFGYPH